MGDLGSDSLKGEINDYFITKISQILEQIDDYKQEIIDNKKMIFRISERLHALYLILYNEMTDPELDKQKEYVKVLKILKGKVAMKGKSFDGTSVIIVININKTNFLKYKYTLERREISINKTLKRIGFLATQETRKLS